MLYYVAGDCGPCMSHPSASALHACSILWFVTGKCTQMHLTSVIQEFPCPLQHITYITA